MNDTMRARTIATGRGLVPTTYLTDRFASAVSYASAIHATQTRKGTELPYLCHLLAAAGTVLEAGGDEDQAIGALLHDAAEDQGGEPRLADIRARFGERVAAMVAGCSDSLSEDSGAKAPYRERKEQHLQHLAEASQDVILVSAADKLHNARAIATDLAVHGPSMLLRFNAGPTELLWYYDSMLAVLRSRQAPEVVTAPLADAISAMREHIDNLPVGSLPGS
jgi:(p)ppGpp synthase/HD superfamily hydrolase